MIAVIDLHDIVEASSDLTLLQAHVHQLVGEKFLFFRCSYGDELNLHLGKIETYTSLKLKQIRRGEFQLGARGSPWFLRLGGTDRIVLDRNDAYGVSDGERSIDRDDLESSRLLAAETRVVAAHIVPIGQPLSSIGLSLIFSDETTFSILPDESNIQDSEDAIADWEVFTPRKRILIVGPGPQWKYVPTDRPV